MTGPLDLYATFWPVFKPSGLGGSGDGSKKSVISNFMQSKKAPRLVTLKA
ncbi:MAG: hypothetical protein L7U47_08890 [Alphaproteobacteria bacterium]|nr:hypothetical protein [Alphaproteobacteria bacterium]